MDSTVREAWECERITMTVGYLKIPGFGWKKYHSLDELCENQRSGQTWIQNSKCRGRKFAIPAAFRHGLRNGLTRQEAYQKALETQLTGTTPERCRKGINVDSRNTWIPKT